MIAELLGLVVIASLSLGPGEGSGPAPATTASASDAELRELELDEFVELVRAQGPAAQLAEARIARGEAAERGARLLLPANPTVSVAAGARVNEVGNSAEVQVQLSQPVEIAGERGTRRRAAQAQTDALERELAAVQQRAEAEGRAAFYLALLELERVATAEAVERFSAEVVATMTTLVAAGEESPLRLRLAEAELAQARQQVQDAEYRYRAACNELARLAGWSGEVVVRPVGQLPIAAPPRPTVLADHPRLAAAHARIDAAAAQLVAAKRDGWPHPGIGAYFASEREPGSPMRSQVGLVTVSIPIPAWRRNQGPRAAAAAELRVAEAEAAVVELNLQRELTRTADAVTTSANRLSTYTDELLPRFADNLELVRRAFELGEIDVLEVFVARERFFQLQSQALDVYRDYILAVRDHELAAGLE